MGEHIGPYEIRGELGRGAMAVVWRAWDPKLEREVAIKEPVFPHGIDAGLREELSARFVREGKTAGQLNHPGIVTIFAADVFDGRPAIVMEIIEGQTLADVLDRGPLRPESAAAVLDQLLAAVSVAHSRGIVHRDLKPDNIFITHDGRVKLADFGIARTGSTATLTQAGTVMGTPGYMAPEQVMGAYVDERADIFSIGVIGYEMLVGRNPFGATEGDAATTVMYRIVHEDPPGIDASLRTALPVDLAPVLATALAKHPDDRFPSVEGFRAALAGAPIATSAAGVRPPPALALPSLSDSAALPPARSGNTGWILAGVAGVLLVGLIAVFAMSGGGGGGGSGGGSGGGLSTGGGTTASEMTVGLMMTPASDSCDVGESVTFEVTPSNAAEVSEVELLVDGNPVGSGTSGPFTFTYTPDSAGAKTILARVSGRSGSTWDSDPVALQVAESPEAQVEAVIDEWVSSFRGLDLDRQMACYGPTVSPYFKRSSYSNGKIRADKSKMFGGHYSLVEMDVTKMNITMDGSDRATAVFDKSWDFVGASRFAGAEQQRLRLKRISGRWKIVSEEELEIYWVKRTK